MASLSAEPDDFDIDALYDKHKPRALLSIAQSFRHRSDLAYALRLSVESRDLAITHRDWFTAGHAQREIAIIRSTIGDHRGALQTLEAAAPHVGSLRTRDVVFATLFADYHNSLAVELCELGRLQEATRALNVALASPFVDAYPEWRETSNEIALRGRRPSRSVVAFSRVTFDATPNTVTPDTGNLLRLPVPRHVDGAVESTTRGPATVLDMTVWRKKMVKEKKDSATDKRTYQEMDAREMLLKIMERTAAKNITDDQLRRILEAIDGILPEYKGQGK